MDLYAYANIENVKDVLTDNNITVPRLRGLRLMKNEKCMDTEIDDYIKCSTLESLLESYPYAWDSNSFCTSFDSNKRKLVKKYIDKKTQSIKWDKIHGKHRKILKFELKKLNKAAKLQADTFNKYVDREDVLYVHARIGGNNWNYFKEEVINNPRFLEKVDDFWDSTYCDLYYLIENTK